LAPAVYGIAGEDYTQEEIEEARQRRARENREDTTPAGTLVALQEAASINDPKDEGESLAYHTYERIIKTTQRVSGELWPSTTSVIRPHDSWNDAKRAAGLRTVKPGGRKRASSATVE
jgi:hypothetical protein